MSVEESQTWSWEASGWASGSIFVRFLYSFSALLIFDWELDDDAAR